MSRGLHLRPEAQADVREAFRWYNAQFPGLGTRFLGALDREFERLLATPEIHGTFHRELRRALVQRFPYAIFYLLEGQEITVFAVIHTSRSPARWKERLR